MFVKKEEMIRHFKWHKKRDESLQHGFMRYSPMDDCSDRFRGCSHNRKQTHYHCLKVRASAISGRQLQLPAPNLAPNCSAADAFSMQSGSL